MYAGWADIQGHVHSREDKTNGLKHGRVLQVCVRMCHRTWPRTN